MAGYLQDRIFLKNKLTFLYGLRTTWYNLTGKLYLEPRISANYQMNDHWKQKASWGKYFQYTNQVIRENVLEGNRDFWLLADDDLPFKRGGFIFQMVTRPVNDDFYEISPRELTHFGTHRVIVFSVNEEYVNLYETQEQDTRKLNEPFSNIENGLGIFASFSSDTLYFEVVPVYD